MGAQAGLHGNPHAREEAPQPRQSVVFSHQHSSGFVLLEHPAIHLVHGGLHGLLPEAVYNTLLRLPAQRLADLPEPVQGSLIAIGHSEDPWGAAALLQNLRRLSGLIPEHQIQPCAARLLQGSYAGVHAEAGAQGHVEGLGHEVLELPYIRAHTVGSGGDAHQVIYVLPNLPGLGELLGQQRPDRLAAQAIVAPEAALIEAHQSGLHLILHVVAHALDIRSDY